MASNKTVKKVVAAENSRHHLKNSFTYKGVDGRCYQTEPGLEEYREPTKKEIEFLSKAQNMSMLELFRLERFLTDGYRLRNHMNMTDADKKRIQTEYPIVYVKRLSRYMGDLDEVWAVLKAKFPEASSRYKNYKACQYALKYGAEPCDWGRGDKDG